MPGAAAKESAVERVRDQTVTTSAPSTAASASAIEFEMLPVEAMPQRSLSFVAPNLKQ